MPTTKRSYAAGHYALEIEGAFAGFLYSVEGGAAYSEVITEAAVKGIVPKKHLGKLAWDQISFEVGMSMGKELYDWILQTMNNKPLQKNGAIVELDAQDQIIESTEFYNAYITQITFPKLDGSSKEAAKMTIKFAPEYTYLKNGSGKLVTKVGTRNKRWLTSNFRLEMDGLDGKGVSKIDSFAWKQLIQTTDIGETRDYQKEPSKIEVPNLKVTLSASQAESWVAWADDFIIKGNNGETKEKSGSIIFLAPDLKKELGRVKLFNIGIFRLAREKTGVGSGNIRRLIADLYCDRMEFELPR